MSATKELTRKELDFISQPSGWLYAMSLDDVYYYDTQRLWMDGVPGKVFELTKKSRRVGYTYAKAQAAIPITHTIPGSTVIFTSMNLQEAHDKIEIARQAYYGTHPDMRKELVTDQKMMLEFAHDSRTVSRVVCQFKPRGQKGRLIFVNIDEFNYILNQEEVLTAAIPNVTHGGRVSIGGSVHSGNQFFDEMWNGTFREDVDAELTALMREAVVRVEVPWWKCPFLVDQKWLGQLGRVAERAKKMDTRERVMTFGSKRLKYIYAASYPEHFHQEYELIPIADGTAVIPWETIVQCAPTGTRLEPGRDSVYPEELSALRRGRLSSFQEAVRLAENHGGRLWLGYDVGRKRNTSELSVDIELPREDVLYECYYDTLEKKPFRVQKEVLRSYLAMTKRAVLTIDASILGANVAEDLKREFRRRVILVEFQNYNKLQMFDLLLARMQTQRKILCADRNRMDQLHSVKRRVSEAGNVIYYVPRKERHHADKAVSQALASYGRDGKMVALTRGRVKTGGRRRRIGERAKELTPSPKDFKNDLAEIAG